MITLDVQESVYTRFKGIIINIIAISQQLKHKKNVFLRYTVVQQPDLLFSSQISGAKQTTCFEFKTLLLKQLLRIIKIRSGK